MRTSVPKIPKNTEMTRPFPSVAEVAGWRGLGYSPDGRTTFASETIVPRNQPIGNENPSHMAA